MGDPQNEWCIMENPIKMPLFHETPIYICIYVYVYIYMYIGEYDTLSNPQPGTVFLSFSAARHSFEEHGIHQAHPETAGDDESCEIWFP